ncbi:MAG: hypothetical protein ACM3PV_05945 [Betaproteobacteria bacterium]
MPPRTGKQVEAGREPQVERTTMQLLRDDTWRPAAVALVALTLTVCGGGGKGTGTGPSVPVTPTPTATPVAVPTPEPISASCDRLPLGSAQYTCRDETPSFLVEVSDAIETLKKEHPEYFNGDVVTNLGGYYLGLIRILDRQNICAGFDGEELAVKNTTEFSDQYKVITSWGQIRKAYIGTCYPAVFPLSRPASGPPQAGCSLPTSSDIACGRPDPRFLGDVEDAISQVLVQKPELFDFSQHAPGTDWPAVRDLLAYQSAVLAVLSQKGYCGKFDGEEIQIKRSNEFSEHYDVNYADQYVRRGAGSFRGSCYPAAF